ncbi:bicyclomycin resistance protein [Roseateles sp. DAIF2]|nr:bicyclomycin resistance protein [Roseateles sp. DAIF2]
MAVAAAPVAEAQVQPPPKVLRYAFNAAETGFDPAQLQDLYSRIIVSHIFDGLYEYDYLARPYKIRPNVAQDLPESSPDFKVWTIRIKPGIYFADDPAFGGKKRELVAQDFVYALKRFFDPANKSPAYTNFRDVGILGLEELRQAALNDKKPFDYDKPIEGLRAPDRYTLQFRLKAPRPRLLFNLASSDLLNGVAREVVEYYGDKIMAHPVGTGPFMLKSWRRSSLVVLEKNPGYRERYYDAEPNADDAQGQAWLARFKGRRLPLVDRVEVAIIEEDQPRWLSFLNGEFDLSWVVPAPFATVATPKGKLAPNLARQGIQMERILAADRYLYYWNMEDPVVGGITPERVALRRAIALGTDIGREISMVWRDQAVRAESVVAPYTWGYEDRYKNPQSDYDPARAKALLDMYGYVDKDGDGWRDQPDGQPLVIRYASQPDARSRSFDEMWQRDLSALQIRLEVKVAKWPENLKSARAGQLMVWQLGFSSNTPDVQPGLELLYGPSSGNQNFSRFRDARFDAIYEQMQALPDGPERLALLREAQRITAAYAPNRYLVHRIITDLSQPWLIGYKRPPFALQFWQYVDIDTDKQKPQ